MKPSRDPNSDKYPDRIFHSGSWKTEDQIKRGREYCVEHKERIAQYRANNRDRQRELARRNYEKNRERYYATHREWVANNPDRRRKISRECSRRKLGWYDEGGMATQPLEARRIA